MTAVDDLLRAARARLRRLAPAEAAAAQAAGAVIVDIRADAQRAADGLVPGALVVPRNVLEWRADPSSPERDHRIADARGPVIVMCAEGYASSLAAATLQDLGLPGATDMAGGFVAWRAAGLPVAPPPGDRDGAPRQAAGAAPRAGAAATALALIRRAGAARDDPLIDIGGSGLPPAALAAGFRDVTVLHRGPRVPGAGVSWIVDDVRTWVPPRRYALWHDATTLGTPPAGYAAALAAALRSDGHAVVAAPGSAPEAIAAGLGLRLVEGREEGPLSWALLRRR